MSGHKRTTVTISQDEYRRLYDAERKHYYNSFSIPEETIYPILQESQNHLFNSYQQIADRQSSYESVINSFQDQLRDVENITSQSLVDQQVKFYNKLMESSQQLWNDTNQVLNEQNDEFKDTVQFQHDELLSQLAILQTENSKISNRNIRSQTHADDWFRDAVHILEFIQVNYPHELINFQLLDNIHQQLSLASNNFENGLYEASLSISQLAFTQLSSYRLSLENKFSSCQASFLSLYDRLLLIKEQCEGAKTIQAIDIQGEFIDEYIDTDYWNDNQRIKISEEIQELISHISTGDNWCNEYQIKSINEEIIPNILDTIATITTVARRNALNAQLRYNTAQMVMISLINQGYKPDYGQFKEDDQRNGYLASATGPDGSMVTIKVDPTEGLSSSLEIETSDNDLLTESELKRRTIEIMQSIEPFGLHIGKIEEVKTPNLVKTNIDISNKVKSLQPVRS